jgi:hypothetical protein
VVLARWLPDRCGFVPVKRPQRADNFPCPIHTRFEQLRCLRRVVHGSRFSHVTRRNAKGPSSPLFLARSSWTTNSMESTCCTDTR